MLTAVHPKLPMRSKEATKDYYEDKLEFQQFGGNYPDYLMLQKDTIQIHFFEFRELDPKQNYGQVCIRIENIEDWYRRLTEKKVPVHPAGQLQIKPRGMKEFSLLDPDHNLLTFGDSIS